VRTATFAVALVVSGNMRFRQNGREYLVGKGQAYIIRKGCNFTIEPGPAGVCRTRVMRMDGPLLGPILQASGLSECDMVDFPDSQIAVRVVKRAHSLLRDRKPGYLAALSGCAYELLTAMGEAVNLQQYPEAVRRALSIMQREVGGRLRRDQLCAEVGLSIPHLSRLFRQHLGESPMRYYVREKMGLAGEMLKATSLSVKEISAGVGYDNPLYFSSEFKKHMGVSPRGYRRRMDGR
jgi:AraC-like DNA-binding protein